MALFRNPALKAWHPTMLLAGLTLVVLALSVPASLQAAREHGGFYLFSSAFFEDIPKRLAGPGRFRFVVQPVVALILGLRAGRADFRAGRPAYLYALVFHRKERAALLRGALGHVANLLLMGILIDSICQWLILGISYPGAALVVGPVLIMVPYSVARALSNRVGQLHRVA